MPAVGPDKITVLIADDDRMTRALVRQAMMPHGDIALVAEADNGFDAVALTLELRPNVAVLDVDMPVLNGLQAAEKIIAGAPKTKVLMFSANAEPEVINRAFKIGVVGYLAKEPELDIAAVIRSAHAGHFFFRAD